MVINNTVQIIVCQTNKRFLWSNNVTFIYAATKTNDDPCELVFVDLMSSDLF